MPHVSRQDGTPEQAANAGRVPMSLIVRAAMAIGLMLGFYLLALGIASVLAYIPYAQWTYTNHLTVQLAVFCVAGAVGILWSVLPRFERFVAPGPRLEAHAQPQLFQAVRGIAAATGQEMPSEIYLVPDLNAWVRDRGGVLGLGSRRVMGLGLPLLQLLTVHQFQAVLAHEFGHYFRGDTKLGPWIYKTRGAIARTLQRLHGSILQKPFVLYGELFLQITLAVSRRQEFAADGLAAQVVGPAPLIEGLKSMHAVAPAFDRYWQGEVVPVLSHGYRPPIADGFTRFVAASSVASMVHEHLEQQLAESQAAPYDTHPALRERIAALQSLPAINASPDDRRATCLLADIDALEVELLGSLGPRVTDFKTLAWEDIGETVYLPIWNQASIQYAAAFEELKPEVFPRCAEKMDVYAERFPQQQNAADPIPEEKRRWAMYLTGAALATVLVKRGWHVRVPLGESVVVAHDGVEVKPFEIMTALISGSMSAENWLATCDRAGIRELDLGAELLREVVAT